MNPHLTFDWDFVLRHLPAFGPAITLALEIFSLSILFAGLWGILLALGRMSPSKVVRQLTTAYIELYRNTPLLIQLYFVFFGLPFLGIRLSALVSGVLAITLQHGAFFAEIFRGAIKAISAGQYDAGTALGMSRRQLMRKVILPQAIRDAMPPVGNQVVLILQDTSLVSTIGVMEVTLTGYSLAEQSAARLEMFLTVGAIYLVLTSLLGALVRQLELRYRVLR